MVRDLLKNLFSVVARGDCWRILLHLTYATKLPLWIKGLFHVQMSCRLCENSGTKLTNPTFA
jgi:hypothetical protein